MNCLCFMSCRFRHPLSRTAGRCRKHYIHAFAFKISYYSIDRCCFTRSRSAGYDNNSASGRRPYSLPLHALQCYILFFFNGMQVFIKGLLIRHIFKFKCKKSVCYRKFRVIHRIQVNRFDSIDITDHHFAVYHQIRQYFLRFCNKYSKKPSGFFYECIHRIICMSGRNRRRQSIQYAALDAEWRIKFHSGIFCYFICYFKTHAFHVVG